MTQILQLDALVTMLACLSTTHTDLGSQLLMSMDNTTAQSCPLSAFSSMTTRIQQLSTGIASAKEQIGELQEQLADLRRYGVPRKATTSFQPSLSPRSIDFGPEFLDAAVASSTTASEGPAIPPRSCLKQRNGSVRIQLDAKTDPFFVFCDQNTRGGGWTLIANRKDGSEDFNRTWLDYKIGFGPLSGEFFIGLEKLHQITNSEDYELLVEMRNANHVESYATYNCFRIASETEQYRLDELGKYRGDAGDGLRQHLGKKFSTHDKASGESPTNCALKQSGAFWYGSTCNLSNPFGIYVRMLGRDVDGYIGILWQGFLNGPKGSLKQMRMLVRPRPGDK